MYRDVLERTDELELVRQLTFNGYPCRKDGRRGWPDQQVFLGDGRHFWVECKKRHGGRLTKAQELVIPKLRARGDVVLIRPTIAEALATAERLTQGVKP